MFSVFPFFRKKTLAHTGLELLRVDMHSHLVPGVDDGAKDLEESIFLIESLYALGYRTLITTPHIRPEYFPNEPETLLERFAELQGAVAGRFAGLTMACAAEYYVDFGFLEYMERKELLTFSGRRVLIELSTIAPPPNLEEIIFALRLKGLQPVVAHPERYGYFRTKEFMRIRELGCEFQINLMSLVGHYGTETRQRAEKLIDTGLVDFFGSDCHIPAHIGVLRELANKSAVLKRIRRASPRNSELVGE